MGYVSTSQKILIAITIVLIFITAVSGWEYFAYWAPLAGVFFTLYLVGKWNSFLGEPSIFDFRLLLLLLDLMFMDEKQFPYEPDYYNWKDVNEPDYW